MNYTCAFTGHRLFNANELDLELLDRVVLNLIKKGTNVFLCGMAMGFDMQAALSVLKFKKEYGVKLIACVPCNGQDLKYPAGAKNLYRRILEQCDEVRVLSDHYYEGCMHSRNRYMVDNCEILVSFLRSNRGGTFYTVNYAKSKDKKIISL